MAELGIRFAILGSGSDANAYIFSTGGCSIVVDNGFSAKECTRRMIELGFDPWTVKAVFVTHTHSDHVRGVRVLSKQLKAPVYSHPGCRLERAIGGKVYNNLSVDPASPCRVEALEVQPFYSSHDSPFSLGYHIRAEGVHFSIITDTGCITEKMYSYAGESDVLFLESNYDEEMLETGPYPGVLKKRIASEQGHLSNVDAIDVLNRLEEDGTSRTGIVYFCHMSKNNNSPEKLGESVQGLLKWSKRFTICPRGSMHKDEVKP